MQKLYKALLSAAPFAVRLYPYVVLGLWVAVIAGTLTGPTYRNLARVQIGRESVAFFWLILGAGMGAVWLISSRILARLKISLIRQRMLPAFTANVLLILAYFLGLGVESAFADHASSTAVFPNLAINGKAARLILDTGGDSALWVAGAKRLGVKFADAPADDYADALSESVAFTVEGNSFSTPMMIHAYASEGADQAKQRDGAIGWSEVRDDILVFDSNQHTVRSARELPAETAGWVKLKVVPGLVLLLEIPLPDHKTGRLLVDTGFTGGVGLPPREWAKWKAANPNARVTSFEYDGAWIGSGGSEQAQAEDITLGPLVLTQVEVDKFPTSGHAEIAVLGMEAIARMDLVVDGKNGWAYMRPRAAGKQGGKDAWTVSGDVRINGASLLATARFDRGLAKERNDDWNGALADFTQAIELDPKMFLYFLARGTAKETKGDYAGAMTDFDRLVELNPTDAESYTNRGECRQMLGKYAEALADYASAIQIDPGTARDARLLRQLVLLQDGSSPPDSLPPARGPHDAWTKTLAQYVAGRVDETKLWDAAKGENSPPNCAQQTEAGYFVGMMHLLKDDRAGAIDNFHKAMDAGDKGSFHRLAQAELGRIGTEAAPLK